MSNKIYVDGASRGNPGPAAVGIVIMDGSGELFRGNEYIGETTNNIAEYTALYKGLVKAEHLGLNDIEVYLDSELVYRQFQGIYRVRKPELQEWLSRINHLTEKFSSVKIFRIPRAENKIADHLANLSLNQHSNLR